MLLRCVLRATPWRLDSSAPSRETTGGPPGGWEEALDEVERIENLISLYRAQTDIGRINAQAGEEAPYGVPETLSVFWSGPGPWPNGPTAHLMSRRAPLVRVGFHGERAVSRTGGGGGCDGSNGWSRDYWMPRVRSDWGFPGAMLDLGAMGRDMPWIAQLNGFVSWGRVCDPSRGPAAWSQSEARPGPGMAGRLAGGAHGDPGNDGGAAGQLPFGFGGMGSLLR